uniref:Uncharacterized protein n=1 Tax=Hyaloperonospora arabidopsidis (strain Emoy2) TaxID=559515 RepID=M4BM30_HYAAE
MLRQRDRAQVEFLLELLAHEDGYLFSRLCAQSLIHLCFISGREKCSHGEALTTRTTATRDVSVRRHMYRRYFMTKSKFMIAMNRSNGPACFHELTT